MLENIFIDPRAHTGLGYYTRAQAVSEACAITLGSEEQELLLQLRRIEKEAALLEHERREVAAALTAFSVKRAQVEAEERARMERAKREAEELAQTQEAAKLALRVFNEKTQLDLLRSQFGTNMTYRLVGTEHVEAMWGPTVSCVAMAGDCTLMTYDPSNWAWTAGLPTGLLNKLQGRQRSLPRPTFVVMGPQERYFIRFADGKSQWSGGNSSFDEVLEGGKAVEKLAFGTPGEFCVLFEDGSGRFSSGLPTEFRKAYNKTQKEGGGVSEMTLGPEGEWFVRGALGGWSGNWSNHGNDTLNKQIHSLKSQQRAVKKVLFGGNDVFFIRFS
jgi:hypothetical protein